MVAAATTTLCDAANAAVQGNASEERLVAGAKQVSNSTAQLLLACRVKADSNSETQRRLQVRVLIPPTLTSSVCSCFSPFPLFSHFPCCLKLFYIIGLI